MKNTVVYLPNKISLMSRDQVDGQTHRWQQERDTMERPERTTPKNAYKSMANLTEIGSPDGLLIREIRV